MELPLRRRLIPMLATVAALALTPAAHAATDTTSVSLLAGTLDYTTPFTAGNFPATTLTGLPQVVHATVNPWIVTDGRGSPLNGWNVTISATQFSTGGASPTPCPRAP